MRKHSTSSLKGKPVTISQLEKILSNSFIKFERKLDKYLDRRFKQVDERFKQVDQRFKQVDQRFKQVDRRFKQIDRKFIEIDKNFATVNGKLTAYFSAIMVNMDKAIRDSEERLHNEILDIKTSMDAFLKRSEANEREILLLGKQHDNLAHYCTEKIGYPVYGRNVA